MTVGLPATGAFGGEISLIGWSIDATGVQDGRLWNRDGARGSTIDIGVA
jgi:hypothetical protein